MSNNQQKEENKNNIHYSSPQEEPNLLSQKKVQYFSDNSTEKNRQNDKFNFRKTFTSKTNEKFLNTGNNIFYINNRTSYRRRNKKNHIIKLKNNMLLNKDIPGCSPYDPYLINVCKNAIVNVKEQLPNYKEVINKINKEFGIEEDINSIGFIRNNKLTKTYNTLSEFKTNYTNEHNFFKKENKINNTEIKENSKK